MVLALTTGSVDFSSTVNSRRMLSLQTAGLEKQMLIHSCRIRRRAVSANIEIPDHHKLRQSQTGSSGELRMRISAWRTANLHQQGQKCT